jgi:hypothetical protein
MPIVKSSKQIWIFIFEGLNLLLLTPKPNLKFLELVLGRQDHPKVRFSWTLTYAYDLHSNSKFQVFATEAYRSEKSTETFDNSTEVSGEINETFESVSISEVSFLVKFINLIRNLITVRIFQALANVWHIT